MMYFAFGSNLNEEQMLRRCPNARVVGRASLPNHKLVFGGHSARWGGAVATVERAAGSQVEGVLYELGARDLSRLDQFEGAPWVYQRYRRDVRDLLGNRRRAVLYRMPGVEPKPPAERYLAVLLKAYQRWGLDVTPIAALARKRTAAIRRESGDAPRAPRPVGAAGKGSPPRRPENAPVGARVFVYGSLLTGYHNHPVLEGCPLLGPARTLPQFDLLDLGRYPAMVCGGATSVAGELYAVSPATLAALDHLEGHPVYYHRMQVELHEAATAWAYVMDPLPVSGRPRIPSGSWRHHRATKES